MKFDDLLSRADDEVLQELIGQAPLRLISLLDQDLLSPARQRGLLLRLKCPQDLLLDRNTRALLLDLLRPSEAAGLSSALGGRASDDPYKVLRSISFRSQSQVTVLLSYFELTARESLPDEVPPDVTIIEPLYPLFPYQRGVQKEVGEYLTGVPHRAVLHMPTGAGKTRTAMHIVSEHLSRRERGVVVWLAHSEELCDQAVSEFIRAWKNIGNRELAVCRFWGAHNPDLLGVHDGFVVAGLRKLFEAAKQNLSFIGQLGKRVSLVVMDEAHQAIAPTYQLILQTLVDPYPGTELLGLTATPGRTWADVDADEKLAEFFARRKVTLEIPGYASPIDFLVEQGYLARAQFRSLFHEGGVSLSGADLKYIEENLDLPRKLLDKLALDQRRNLRIIVEIEGLTKKYDRIIVFAVSVAHSDLLAAVLQARGINASSVTAQTPRDERRRILDCYKQANEDVQVLCNYGVLTTGFDAPRTRAAVIARPTTSLVLYSQMVGRAIRGPKAGGNEYAEIVTVVDTGLPGFGDVSKAFANWEDVWGDTAT